MNKVETKALHRRIAGRFPGEWMRSYALSKLNSDPLYGAIFEVLRGSRHSLLDIGCGVGLLAFYLRERGFDPPFTGVDYDARKIKVAQSVAASANFGDLCFTHRDAREVLPEFRGNVTLLDVLQFLDRDAQDELLGRVAASVGPDATLVIRSGLQDASWRFRITKTGDMAAKWIRWMKEAPAAYPTEKRVRETLESAGLEGIISPLWGRTPFNNYLMVFRRPADKNPAPE